MAKPSNKNNYSELVTFNSGEKNKTQETESKLNNQPKSNVFEEKDAKVGESCAEYFGELGSNGEFQGGLMGEDDFSNNFIITSKDDVMRHKRSHQKKIKRFDNSNTACHQCLIQ